MDSKDLIEIVDLLSRANCYIVSTDKGISVYGDTNEILALIACIFTNILREDKKEKKTLQKFLGQIVDVFKKSNEDNILENLLSTKYKI